MQCQRSGLDWSGFLHFLHFFEPVQVLGLPGLDFLHFLSLCRFWSLGRLKLHRLQKITKKTNPLLVSEEWKTDWIAELFHRSIVLQNFPEVCLLGILGIGLPGNGMNFSMTKGGDELSLNLIREDDVLQEEEQQVEDHMTYQEKSSSERALACPQSGHP